MIDQLAGNRRRPFRFIAPMPSLDRSPAAWRDAIRRIEDLGFSTVSVSDHLTHGWSMEPTIAMTAAAEATQRLRVLSLVLANDFRHPVVVHRAAAMIDLLSGGRLELGLGAGWMADDYEAAGLPFDPPDVRLGRLSEAARLIKALFGPEPVTFEGRHYRTRALEGLPRPVQTPRPPLLIGGGGRRALTIAATEADIVGIHAALADSRLTPRSAADLAADRVAEKVAIVNDAARAAARDPASIELQFTVYLCRIDDSPGSVRAQASAWAGLLAAEPDLVARSPAVLVGSLEHCIELLQERRETLGLSYINLGSEIEAVAPIVSRLAGT